MKRVGILGGGQLGTMLATAIQDLGGDVSVYDPDPLAPARRRTNSSVCASWTDATALRAFIESVDVVTYEFENIDTSALRPLSSLRPLCPIVPPLSLLEETQDRIREKELCRSSGLPHVAYRAVASADDLAAAGRDFGFPSVLKTARGGYDGKGQAFLRSSEELAAAAERFANVRGGFVLEEAIDLDCEVSCIVARDSSGGEVVFPIFENLHRDHVLDYTVLPARLDEKTRAEVQTVARQAARALSLSGLLTVEFFIGRSRRDPDPQRRRIFVNEFAPRPHNSGHVTLAACTMSQFSALARILLDVPLVTPRMVGPGSFCMGNLLGDVWLAQGAPARALDLSAWASHPDVIDVRLYGKSEAQAQRKMGHFITRGDTGDEALAAARRFRDDLIRAR